VVGTVPCEIPHDDRSGHREFQAVRSGACMQEAGRNDGRAEIKRAQLMSTLGRKYSDPGFPC
jgi:hypothetical protein